MAVEIKGTRVWLILHKAARAVEEHARAHVISLGLCLSDFAVLEVLLHKGPLPVNAIGEKVLLTSGSISSAIDRLEKKGWVRRQHHPGDRRRVHVELTASGHSLIQKAFSDHEIVFDAATTGLNNREKQEIVPLLKKLGHHAGAHHPKRSL